MEPKIFWSAMRRKESWRWEVIHSPSAPPVFEQRRSGAMDNFQDYIMRVLLGRTRRPRLWSWWVPGAAERRWTPS